MHNLSHLFTNQNWQKIILGCMGIMILITLLYSLNKKKDSKNDLANSNPYPHLDFIHLSKPKAKLNKKDIYAIILLTSMYGFISFFQLGSKVMPSTTWQPQVALQEVIFELPETTHFDEIYGFYGEGDNNAKEDGYQLGFDNTKFYGSNDLINWDNLSGFSNSSIYRYQILKGNWDYHYVKMISGSIHDTVTEIAFKNNELENFIPVTIYQDDYLNSNYPATLMIDEQSKIPLEPTYLDESYFDEIYHPRNAWEIANQQFMYPHVHPLFGTSIIALSIHLFGMNPFAWRLPGVLFGILMIPLLYLILKTMFDDSRYASIGTLLFSVEFMHLVTSRIGTLEPFSVFFIMFMFYYMIRYCQTSFYDTSLNKTLLLLLKCGIVMGIGFATKWTVCYSAIGLAILFFTTIYLRFKEYKKAEAIMNDSDKYKCLNNEEKQFVQHIKNSYKSYTWTTIAWCFLFFIGIPAIIYALAYIPCPAWKDGYSIKNVIKQNDYMYHYHINLHATHPYQSEWYQWIVDARPIWYYGRGLQNGNYQSIACFSNPIICWFGLISILYTIYDLCKKNNRNLNAWIIVVGYMTAFLPWVSLVQRCVFAYHFYPTSIFMILSIVYTIQHIERNHPKFKNFTLCFTIASVFVFFMFLPVLLGIEVHPDYIKYLEWFPSWYFG